MDKNKRQDNLLERELENFVETPNVYKTVFHMIHIYQALLQKASECNTENRGKTTIIKYLVEFNLEAEYISFFVEDLEYMTEKFILGYPDSYREEMNKFLSKYDSNILYNILKILEVNQNIAMTYSIFLFRYYGLK